MANIKKGRLERPGSDKEKMPHSIFKLRFYKRLRDVCKGLWFGKFVWQGQSSNWKMTIEKGGMSKQPDNDQKMATHSSFKVGFSERPFHIDRGF